MYGLLLKDIYNLRRYVKQISISIVVFGLFAINLKNPAYLIGMITMMTSMMVITSMSYDEYAKWDKYALTMPILKKDIVLSKYLLLILSTVAGAALSTILALIMSAFMKLLSLKELLLASGAVSLVMLFLFGILIPVLYKYGIEKARMLMFAVFGIPILLVTLFVKLMLKLNVPQPSQEQIEMLCYAFPVIVLIVLFLSYNISVKIFNKKEL
ncbi:ABC-2 transporter permease [Anaerocolumna sp. AGMB13025]|uniref:ABC-2 transporter permease n=1 Tax=Anaerocolumna sp. AGMB13025 TaxID=3039116 RepID=UPI00241FED38|nr:ABC-2 transporter permease [Anaerocolumna sp. AGMB13025]WFR57776.1 ABC-2 transporter permease [Anaerocolumna sp. AGMB13025]